MLIAAVLFITLAFILYSIGVWSEKIQKILKPWHAAVFWAGFLCDTAGTTWMSLLAGNSVSLSFHAVTGAIAILLMLFHAVWATVVLGKKNESLLRTFHKFSIVVWIIWLIPYLSGMFVGMAA